MEALRDQMYVIARVIVELPATSECDGASMFASLENDERIDVEERAAVMEFEGGLSRDQTERAAFASHMKSRRVN